MPHGSRGVDVNELAGTRTSFSLLLGVAIDRWEALVRASDLWSNRLQTNAAVPVERRSNSARFASPAGARARINGWFTGAQGDGAGTPAQVGEALTTWSTPPPEVSITTGRAADADGNTTLRTGSENRRVPLAHSRSCGRQGMTIRSRFTLDGLSPERRL